MRADQKIRENTARSQAMAPLPPHNISVERLSRSLPNPFTHLPLDDNVCVSKKVIKARHTASLTGKQFGIDTSGNHQIAGFLCPVKAFPRGSMDLTSYIP